MKIVRALIFMGIIGVATFFLQDIVGSLLWKEYNPISMYISCLMADGAPNLPITRSLYNAYSFFLILFFVGMCYLAYRFWRPILKIGYTFLLIALSLSLVGIGSFPMSMENVFAAQNLMHLVFTIGMLVATVVVIYMLAIGYLKEEKLKRVGRVSLVVAILFTASNLLLLYVIIEGLNIAGLIERCSFYTFFIYIFYLSCVFFRMQEGDLK